MTFFWRILENNTSQTTTNHDRTTTKSRLLPGVVMRCFRDPRLVIGFELYPKIAVLRLITPSDRYLPGCWL